MRTLDSELELRKIAYELGATMSLATTGGSTAVDMPDGGGDGGELSFLEGTYEYSEPMAAYTATALGANSVQMAPLNITPGGFLRGVFLNLSSTGGSLGSAGSLGSIDSPWNAIQSISIEAIDGTPILYPMGGYSYYLVSKYTRPWDGDPANDSVYSNSVNPAFNLRMFAESRLTIATLPNTDARAMYRMQLTINSASSFFGGSAFVPSAGNGTNPTLTFTPAVETYQQPPQTDYNNVPIAQLPPGIVLQRMISHQLFPASGGDMTFQSTRVGNLIRVLILIFRNSSGVRTAVSGDPIRWRLDNTQLLVESRVRRTYENNRFGHRGDLNSDNVPTGVYVYPRWHDPGRMDGAYWLETTPQTFLQYEFQDPSNSVSGGTLEIITEDLAVAGAVPQYLEGL